MVKYIKKRISTTFLKTKFGACLFVYTQPKIYPFFKCGYQMQIYTVHVHKICGNVQLFHCVKNHWRNLEFASPSGKYLTWLCLPLSFLIVNPLILQNSFWSYKILVSFITIGLDWIACQGKLWMKNAFSSTVF